MTDPELRERLAVLRPPASTDAARSRALFRANLALDASTRATPASAHAAAQTSRSPLASLRLASGLLLGSVAALALGFWLLRPATPANLASDPAPASSDAARAASLRLLAEVQSLFPGRLNAVVDRDGALQIDLADNSSALASDQAIVVELARAGKVVRILGYSGRAIDLEIGGRALRFAPLLTGGGEVLLAGENFAWSSTQSTPPPPPRPGRTIAPRAL